MARVFGDLEMKYVRNEVTAAIGVAQLQRVNAYLDEYKQNLGILNEAIKDCEWLRNREV